MQSPKPTQLNSRSGVNAWRTSPTTVVVIGLPAVFMAGDHSQRIKV